VRAGKRGANEPQAWVLAAGQKGSRAGFQSLEDTVAVARAFGVPSSLEVRRVVVHGAYATHTHSHTYVSDTCIGSVGSLSQQKH
jgi:hypothetical protein